MRRLIAWLFNRDLALVEFGYDHSLRLVHYSVDNEPFVIICGRLILLDKADNRSIVWLRRDPLRQPPKKPAGVSYLRGV